MSDLIDRQAAIRLVHSVLYEMMVDAATIDIEKPMSKEDKLLLRVNKVVCTKLKELPSAEPEIMRCKDCKYMVAYSDGASSFYYCKNTDCDTKLDGYCHRAERKQDAIS